MQYNIPENITIDEVREAITRANDRCDMRVFIEADRGDHVIFNYILSFDGVFPFPGTGDVALDREYAILRECRGLTFYKDGRVAARKWNKFFNLLEKPETQPDVIDWSQPHGIFLKEDGSMITPFINDNGEISWHTKMGDTDVAKLVSPFVVESPSYYEAFARDLARFGNGITPLFEFCSRSQRIVVDHPQDRMVLLGARFNDTGEYVPHSALEEWGRDYKIEVVARHDVESVSDARSFLNDTAAMTGIEGFVIAFENGMRYKIKTEEYRTIHRVVSDIASEKNVIRMIVDNSLDDALPLLAEEDRAHVLSFSHLMHQGLDQTAQEALSLAQQGQAVTNDQRGFAEWVGTNVPAQLSSVVFRVGRGGDAKEALVSLLSKNIGSGPRIDNVRNLWGGHRWNWGDQMTNRLDDE